MAVSLTVSESMGGSGLSDALAGGGSGLDLGSVINGKYSPITDQAANTGQQMIFISHNATIDPITSVKFYIGNYTTETGFTYGGARSAADDLTALITMGNGSGSSKNNYPAGSGSSAGLWIDMRWNASDALQFDQATYPTKVKIFGDSGTDGIDLASAFPLITDAMTYNNSSVETAATAPEAGKIGRLDANDGGGTEHSTLGEYAHIRMRQYIASAFAEGGIYQVAFVIAYSYTA